LLFNVSSGQLVASFTNVDFKAKISTFTDASEQVGALKVTLKYLDKAGDLPSSYIDVRVPGRTFVL